MLAKIAGLLVLVVVALLALKIAGFLVSMIWKIGMVAFVAVVVYLGWQFLKR